VLPDQLAQHGIESRELTGQEPDPGSDRLHGHDGDAVFHGGSVRGCHRLDPVQLLGQRATSQIRAQVLRCDDDQALELVDRLGTTRDR